MPDHMVLVLAEAGEPELELLRELPPGTRCVSGSAVAKLRPSTEHATVIFNWTGGRDLLREVFTSCPKLQWVHTRGAGVEKLLFPELLGSPVVFTNGSGVFSPALAEFALASMLYFQRGFRRLVRNQQAQVWEEFDTELIAGRTVGIVGYGDIGRNVAERARALGMRVLAVSRSGQQRGPAGTVDDIFKPERMREMLARCDFIVVSTPLTPETRRLIGAAELAVLKPSAVIVNLGRGPVIDEGALVSALREKRIKGAALDVFDQEPLPAGHPFYSLENVLLSPHCADHTPDWKENAVRFFLAQFQRFHRGDPLLNVVDKARGY